MEKLALRPTAVALVVAGLLGGNAAHRTRENYLPLPEESNSQDIAN